MSSLDNFANFLQALKHESTKFFIITLQSFTLVIVIFHSDNQPSSCLGAGNQQILIDRLEGEGVNDTNIDALPLELVGSGEGLVQSNTSSHNSHLVAVRLTNNLQQFTKINTFFAMIFILSHTDIYIAMMA